jgi:hypothetical protein
MTSPLPGSSPPPSREFPRVPAYAWSWLQRSRPVLSEAADRLTGGPPAPDFLDELKRTFRSDPFVRDVLIGVIADVAFNGRIPTSRPPGVQWDRGLIWWAAAIAGVPPAAFEAAGRDDATQRQLFEVEGAARDDRRTVIAPVRRMTPEQGRLAAALRQLLATAEGDRVPASAVRQLIDQLEGGAGDQG